MRKIYRISILAAALFAAASCNSNTNPQANGSHENHDSHLMKVNEQGDKAMGFSHQKTTHHFRLFNDGGAIEVVANDAADGESRDQIRKHLTHIAEMFAAGNFDAPMLTHGKTPPGVPSLQMMKDRISYKYEETERGGRVRISTADKDALLPIYEFLRFQISDHQTGDSTEVTKE
jgi:hypothetical protein